MTEKIAKPIFICVQLFLATATLAANLQLGGFRDAHAKALCCLGFVVMAGISMLYSLLCRHNRITALLLLLGAITGYWGDITLGEVLSIGTLFFAVGHIFYALAFLRQRPSKKQMLYLWGGIFAAAGMLILCHPHLFFPDLATRLAALAYAAVISLMTAAAAALFFRQKSVAALVTLCGAALFFLSDLLLMLQAFLAGFSLPHALTMSVYLLAQTTLHFSTILHKK